MYEVHLNFNLVSIKKHKTLNVSLDILAQTCAICILVKNVIYPSSTIVISLSKFFNEKKIYTK